VIFFRGLVFLVLFLNCVGCSREWFAKSFFAEFDTSNESNIDIWFSVATPKSWSPAVSVSPGTRAVMMGSLFSLEQPLRVRWRETHVENGNTKKIYYETKFSIKEIVLVRDEIKGLKLVFRGGGHWDCRIYKGSHFDQKDLILEIKSTDTQQTHEWSLIP